MALLDDDFNQVMTNPALQMGLGILANSSAPRGMGTGAILGRGAMQGMENVNQANLMRNASEQRRLQALQTQQALAQAQQRQQAIQALPEAQRQAVMAGVPYADIWKRDNPEMKFESYYDEQGRERKGYVTPQGITPVGGAKTNLPEGMVMGPDGQPMYMPAYLQGRKDIASAGKSSTNVFTGQKETFKNERDLRNDFAGLPTTKAFKETQSAADQINTALKSRNPAGDLAAATKFMKILDPGSVVRESELGMAMAATGMLDRAQNYAQMVMSGNKLTPKQREEFGTLSNQLFNAAAGRYNETADEYRTVAQDYGLNADRIAKPVKPAQIETGKTAKPNSTMSAGGWSATIRK
jgi:hypothetical protein